MTTTHQPVDAPAGADSNGSDVPPEPATRRPVPRHRDGISPGTLALGAIFIAAFAFLAATFAVVLAARSVDEHRAVAAMIASGGGAPAAVAVSLAEFSITPDAITVPAGTTTFTVTNDGTVIHNLVVEGRTTPDIESGGSADLEVEPLAAGTYSIHCAIPGHEAAGMVGTITVT